jgi:diaminopimelate decarboxylase
MHHFSYRDGVLFAEDVAIPDLADQIETPFYCYSSATLERHFRVFSDAFADRNALIAFAVKSNSNLAVIGTLARLGAGADVVSLGELKRALAAGVPPQRIVFSGVGKTAIEMAEALKAQIYQFNVESLPELESLGAVAASLGVRAPITFRINPDVDAKTHAKISTGKAENKFGIGWGQARAAYARAAQIPSIQVVGVDVHIGSQITDLEPFEQAFAKVRELILMLRADGHKISRADLGGGLGVPYEQGDAAPPLPVDYGAMVKRLTADLDVQLIFEPGRLIVANAGILVSRVIYVKQGEAHRFLIVDAAMNDLMRPALYDAYHGIIPVREAGPGAFQIPMTVVGPVCESTDTFASDRLLPELAAGDLIAFQSAGAYAAVMANGYNTRLLVPEVLVSGSQWALIRPRPTYDDLLNLERRPNWLSSASLDP